MQVVKSDLYVYIRYSKVLFLPEKGGVVVHSRRTIIAVIMFVVSVHVFPSVKTKQTTKYSYNTINTSTLATSAIL